MIFLIIVKIITHDQNTNISTDAAFKKLMEYLFNNNKVAREKFELISKNKSDKSITLAELDKVLTTLKLAIPESILEKLKNRFETNGNFNWESFLKFIREFVPATPKIDEYATGLTAHEFKILGELLEALQTNFKSLHAAFVKYDANKDGTLSYEEFKNAIESAGINHITAKEVRDIFEVFDKNHNDKVEYKEFLETVNHKYFV